MQWNVVAEHRYAMLGQILCAWIVLMPFQQANADMVVEPDWLQERLSDPGLQVVDVRSRKEYDAGHIEGAINLPVDATFDTGDREGMLAGVSVVRDQLQRVGLRSDRHLILYDDGSYIHAARLFWVLEVYGHEQVSILNIGYPGWVERGLPSSTTLTVHPVSNIAPRIQPNRMATALSTRVAMKNPKVLIIDARTEEEYLGRETQAARTGHIPGAVSVPWDLNVEDGPAGPRLIGMQQLAPRYSELVGDRAVITYCNKGRQSALTYFVLRNLGYDVAAYDGSWLEWGNNPKLPVETGAGTALPANQQ